MKPSPRVIVAFDLGGVVVDVDFGALRRLHADAARVERAFFSGDRHNALSVGAIDGAAYIDAVADALGAAVVDVDAAWRSVVRFSPGGLELVAAVAALDDVDVAVWSNTDPLHWAVLGPALEAVATSVSPSFLVSHQKPERAYYDRAIARAVAAAAAAGGDVEISDIIFVDDRADNVAAAIDVGVRAFVVDGVKSAGAAIFGELASR